MRRLIVPDAGVVVVALCLDDDPRAAQARLALRDSTWHAPAHLSTEAFSVLRKKVRSGEVAEDRARDVLAALHEGSDLTLHGTGGLWQRAWELRETVTAYDAMYVALAEKLGAELVTTDGRLAGAPGPRCEITVVP